MEVRFTPDVEAKLEQMARETGRPSDELVEDAVIGYFDELTHAREILDRRFDDLENGKSDAHRGRASLSAPNGTPTVKEGSPLRISPPKSITPPQSSPAAPSDPQAD